MLKYNKRKSGKPKKLSQVSDKLRSPDTSQSNIDEYFSPVAANDDNLLPESSLPSPDAAALPCATTSCASDVISRAEKKDVDCSENEIKALKTIAVEQKEKKNRVTNSDTSKKKKQTLRNTQLTEFFPVRRSNRKTFNSVMKEKHKNVENAILCAKEDGFEIREFPEKGRGVVTTKPLKRGDFVLEYHGELIDYTEACKRERLYAMKENTGCYMYYFKYRNKRYCIDATKESGRLGRLVNHSKKGNLKTQPIFLQDCPHLALFAGKDIEAGEELTYDYGDRSKEALEFHPWLAL
ncbi:N-lysine methyltransferase KMT5A [Parasteatoda tepidariorum]|uniref:[histone H4]-lysine(20) N-methyltransferase n=2 Tax=Parasteatoda tepidariorum TaxID=114398 RepID=A0A2L2YIR3_PARTP|nr:N-lysine methyltransferase KMT5A [Parasteatoda tepidariorum]